MALSKNSKILASDVSGAIKSITRSGTTFTYTTVSGGTGTFTQQDNNTTYSAGTGISISSNKISNTGVTSVNGSTGAVTISTVSTTNTTPNIALGVYNNPSNSWMLYGGFTLNNNKQPVLPSGGTWRYAELNAGDYNGACLAGESSGGSAIPYTGHYDTIIIGVRIS